MQRPMPRTCGAGRWDTANAHGPRCSCRGVRSPARCRQTVGGHRRRRSAPAGRRRRRGGAGRKGGVAVGKRGQEAPERGDAVGKVLSHLHVGGPRAVSLMNKHRAEHVSSRRRHCAGCRNGFGPRRLQQRCTRSWRATSSSAGALSSAPQDWRYASVTNKNQRGKQNARDIEVPRHCDCHVLP